VAAAGVPPSAVRTICLAKRSLKPTAKAEVTKKANSPAPRPDTSTCLTRLPLNAK